MGWTLVAIGAVLYVDVASVATTTALLVAILAGAIAFGARRLRARPAV